MTTRFLIVALAALSLAACSSTKEQDATDQMALDGQSTMTQGPLDGTEVYGDGTMQGGAGVPGSQEDFVANVGDRVFFGYDMYDLAPEARATLDRQAEWLNRYPNVNVTIEGHADERGTREYNLALGERRANSVKSYLTTMGVDPRRLNTISYGKEQPAVIGDGSSSWAQNRRGVTRVE